VVRGHLLGLQRPRLLLVPGQDYGTTGPDDGIDLRGVGANSDQVQTIPLIAGDFHFIAVGTAEVRLGGSGLDEAQGLIYLIDGDIVDLAVDVAGADLDLVDRGELTAEEEGNLALDWFKLAVAIGSQDGVEGVGEGDSVPALLLGQDGEVDPAVVVVHHQVLVVGFQGGEGTLFGVVVDLGVAVRQRLNLYGVALL
jgi:hypothetical protein